MLVVNGGYVGERGGKKGFQIGKGLPALILFDVNDLPSHHRRCEILNHDTAGLKMRARAMKRSRHQQYKQKMLILL